jgi:cytochrome c oxidase subunit II
MQKYGWGLPIDISVHGAGMDRLIYIIHILMVILFVGWLIFLIFMLVKYRQREGHKAVYSEKHFKAPAYIEVVIVILELLLLVAVSTPIWFRMKNDAPKVNALQIRVVAQQFAWNIHYPGKDGVFGKTSPKLMDSSNPLGLDMNDAAAKDDIATVNQLHIPVHTPVTVQLSSKDVIHSFSLPVMRVKQDVIPGHLLSTWFEATQEGEFEIACAQLCGLGHYRMRGFFIVESKEKFSTWLAEQAPKVA